MGVSAAQVGSYFVGQYYQVLPQHPNLIHQFYSDNSTMIRVDGVSTETASNVLQIHELVLSLNFGTIEIKTINSLDSLDGGVLVMVSGFVKIRDVKKRRKFVQTFFLAPQEKGYFVLNDIFHFIDDGISVSYSNPVSVASEKIDAKPLTSLGEPPEDDLVDKYSLPEQPQQLHQDLETEIVVEETPAEKASPTIPSFAHTTRKSPIAFGEEPLEESTKKTYASILQVAKGRSVSSAALQQSFKSTPTPSESNHVAQPVQQSNSAFTYIPDSRFELAEEFYGAEEEGEVTSVYVRNLPATVTEAEIEHEFKSFGRIKPNGIFVRVKKEIGVCYAFVEFEDIVGVQNSLQASPIQLAGRQVYIEERRPNNGITARGGRRGRGRSSYPTDALRGRFGGRGLGRGSNHDGADYHRIRGNGFPQRGSQ
ncbi:nuclear transport factor 2-like isoform X2 [Arachis stenosperma]|uniref:nuclear transport factor 2-like isoform X2 n=1 Tax=Arachis stenosperma TaxID=217475 RepID=UPI0025AD51BE|nr:nuclear transport factor 2-like isoform X2 [Arachis stenosperma]